MKNKIRLKVLLNYPLTDRERAIYLLLVATDEEAREFLRKEKELRK